MKITKAIHSSDSNPMYLDFWPIVSKIWKIKFNIEPVLIYIDENHDIDISEEYGTVIKLKPVKDIPIYLQNLWVRYWYPSQSLEDTWIISDIDMIPISEKYFITNINQIDDNAYVHLNPCIDTYGTLPSCYHVAKGFMFKKILELHDKWEDSILHLFNLSLGKDPGGHLFGKNHWFADEKYSSEKVLSYKNNNPNEVIFIPRVNGQNGFRIDRTDWVYDEKLLEQDYYIDSHSIRPYSLYKTKIDELINLL
jgi:hypothetical protein